MGPEGTFQPTSPPTILQPFLPPVRLVSGSLLHLVSPQVAQGFLQIPVTMELASDKWKMLAICEQVLSQQGMPL